MNENCIPFFYLIFQVFSESSISEYSVEENIISAQKREVWNVIWHSLYFFFLFDLILDMNVVTAAWQITIDTKQHYKFMGRNIDMISLIKLYTEDGKVVRHEDMYVVRI